MILFSIATFIWVLKLICMWNRLSITWSGCYIMWYIFEMFSLSRVFYNSVIYTLLERILFLKTLKFPVLKTRLVVLLGIDILKNEYSISIPIKQTPCNLFKICTCLLWMYSNQSDMSDCIYANHVTLINYTGSCHTCSRNMMEHIRRTLVQQMCFYFFHLNFHFLVK